MIRKFFVICVGATVTLLGGYYWGFLCGKQSAADTAYEQVLQQLANYILIRDAIMAKGVDSIRPLVDAGIVADFVRMIDMYEKHGFENGEYVRCAVSRRFRKLKQDGHILSDRVASEKEGWPITKIEKYLNTECLGEPSHADWTRTN